MADQPVVVIYKTANGTDQVYATAYGPEQVEDVQKDAEAKGYRDLRVVSASTPVATNTPHMKPGP